MFGRLVLFIFTFSEELLARENASTLSKNKMCESLGRRGAEGHQTSSECYHTFYFIVLGTEFMSTFSSFYPHNR